MKEEVWRLIGVICLSVITGLVIGHVFLVLSLGLLWYVYWQYKSFSRLLIWLRRRSESELLDTPGFVNEIAREFDIQRIHHRQRKDKLAGFLKRFQEATAALPDAVVILGESDNIEWANNKSGEYLKIRWPHDAGQRLSNLIRHPELVEYLKKTRRGDSNQRLELVMSADSDFRLEFRVAPYGDTQRLLVARDITKIHRINQMRKDFIANASHELRTPLTVIAGYLESFEDEFTEPEDIRAAQVKQMRAQTTRMQRLIEDLLNLASLESAEDSEEIEVVKVPELLTSIYKEAEAVSGILEHIFTLEIEAGLWLKGSRNELYSAFSNIVFNAVQYTPAQGVIRIRWYEDVWGAHLEVCDSGVGIAAEHIPRLTERFYRVDKGRSREKGGTGLGLAIVKHILVRHNATLDVQSEPGKGSTFRCNFPAKRLVRADVVADKSISA